MGQPVNAKTQQPLIYNLQLLRAIAALSVVFVHTSSGAGLNLPISFGAFGVDIFFVISGFIISYISSLDPSQFFLKRLIRIVPFYWAATLGMFAVAYFFPTMLRTVKADWPTLLFSLFFIPHDSFAGAHPILLLGWTLNYEMYFYVLFAIALRFSPKHAIALCATAITAILLAVNDLHPATDAGAYYGKTIVLEFVYGMGIFAIWRALGMNDVKARSWDLTAYLASGMAFFCLVFLAFQENLTPQPLRFIFGGVPAMAIVFGVLLLERRYGVFSKSKTLLLIGEASYIIYLIHPYIVYSLLRAGIRGAAHWPLLGKWMLVPLLMAAVSIVSLAIHLWFERPLMAMLRRRLLNKPPEVTMRESVPLTPT